MFLSSAALGYRSCAALAGLIGSPPSPESTEPKALSPQIGFRDKITPARCSVHRPCPYVVNSDKAGLLRRKFRHVVTLAASLRGKLRHGPRPPKATGRRADQARSPASCDDSLAQINAE